MTTKILGFYFNLEFICFDGERFLFCLKIKVNSSSPQTFKKESENLWLVSTHKIIWSCDKYLLILSENLEAYRMSYNKKFSYLRF